MILHQLGGLIRHEEASRDRLLAGHGETRLPVLGGDVQRRSPRPPRGSSPACDVRDIKRARRHTATIGAGQQLRTVYPVISQRQHRPRKRGGARQRFGAELEHSGVGANVDALRDVGGDHRPAQLLHLADAHLERQLQRCILSPRRLRVVHVAAQILHGQPGGHVVSPQTQQHPVPLNRGDRVLRTGMRQPRFFGAGFFSATTGCPINSGST